MESRLRGMTLLLSGATTRCMECSLVALEKAIQINLLSHDSASTQPGLQEDSRRKQGTTQA